MEAFVLLPLEERDELSGLESADEELMSGSSRQISRALSSRERVREGAPMQCGMPTAAAFCAVAVCFVFAWANHGASWMSQRTDAHLRPEALFAVASEGAKTSSSTACHSALAGEACFTKILNVISQGIPEHPEQYVGLSVNSDLQDIQAFLHNREPSLCPPPCESCQTAKEGDDCFQSVKYAMTQGIYAHPAWYPGALPKSSSFEEFQGIIHTQQSAVCPKPCFLNYSVTDTVAYREALHSNWTMFGVSYSPSPLKCKGNLKKDDFMSEESSPLWSSHGRGDMRLIKALGANTLHMYGNDPQLSKRTFLDEAMKEGLDVLAGLSEWPFQFAPDRCDKQQYYCFDQVYSSYVLNLKSGFTINGFKAYHPALKNIILINEPDLKVKPRHLACRAVITALDAVLEAEKDVGVTQNLVSITALFSFAVENKSSPALGQMLELWQCIQNPQNPPTAYHPKNDLVKAFRARFVNSFNTNNPANDVRTMFLEPYKASVFWDGGDLKIPVFIGEYHCLFRNIEDDLQEAVALAKDPKFPFLLGLTFFEFSVRYDKKMDSEQLFGMFAAGEQATAKFDYFGQELNVWSLTAKSDKQGHSMPQAVADAFGGEVPPYPSFSPDE